MERSGVEYDPKNPPANPSGPGRWDGLPASKEAGPSDSTEHNATSPSGNGRGTAIDPSGPVARARRDPDPPGRPGEDQDPQGIQARPGPKGPKPRQGKGANPRTGGTRAGRGSERPH